jgi:hypothetical protein
MTSDRDAFQSSRTTNIPIIGKDAWGPIAGKPGMGPILLQIGNGVLALKQARHVPTLQSNLVS